jgi:hypothetical protein
MDPAIARHDAANWARIIAKRYATGVTPPMGSTAEDEVAARLEDKLAVAITIDVPASRWDRYVNNALDEWEDEGGGRGPRLVAVDEVEETVRMSRPYADGRAVTR